MAFIHTLTTFIPLVCIPTCIALLFYNVFQTSQYIAMIISILSLFVLSDMWYFIRLIQCFIQETIDASPRQKIIKVNILHGRIWLNDIDRNAHSNNARFLRECGFGRRKFWHNNGVWKTIVSLKCNLVVGAQTIRYRRELNLGQAYILETKLLGWDEKAFYLEHRFVTHSKGSREFINAIVIVKNNLLGSYTPDELLKKIPGITIDELQKPPLRDDIKAWIESNKVSSSILRQETQYKKA